MNLKCLIYNGETQDWDFQVSPTKNVELSVAVQMDEDRAWVAGGYDNGLKARTSESFIFTFGAIIAGTEE